MLSQRMALSDLDRQIKSRAIISHSLLHVPAGSAVAGYHSVRGEVDVSTLLKVLAEKGNRICLPAITHQDAPLAFRAWQPGSALVKGSYGIMEPAAGAEEMFPDILLVPLLAFDGKGHRLGYGAGYYDRTIAQLKKKKPSIRTYGMAYAFQRVDSLPAEAHDEKLNAIITEEGMVRP